MQQGNYIWFLLKGVKSWGRGQSSAFCNSLCILTFLPPKRAFTALSDFLHLHLSELPTLHPQQPSPPQSFKLLSLREVHQAHPTCNSPFIWAQGTLIPSPTFSTPNPGLLDWEPWGRAAWTSLMLNIWVSTREQDRVKDQLPPSYQQPLSGLSAALSLVLGTIRNQLRSLLPQLPIQQGR